MKRVQGLDIPQTLEDVCDPRRMALVVYDMQIGILKQLKNPEAILAKVSRVLEASRAAGVRTFFMRHMSLPKELAGVFQLRMAKAWQRVSSVAAVQPWFLRDSPAFQLAPEVTPMLAEAIFDKITMSAFEGTPLNIALRDCGINSVAIVGVATEIGIEPTVRHAADLGYMPVVVTDACGAGDEEAGRRALASLRFAGDAFLTDGAEFCGIMRRKTPAR